MITTAHSKWPLLLSLLCIASLGHAAAANAAAVAASAGTASVNSSCPFSCFIHPDDRSLFCDQSPSVYVQPSGEPQHSRKLQELYCDLRNLSQGFVALNVGNGETVHHIQPTTLSAVLYEADVRMSHLMLSLNIQQLTQDAFQGLEPWLDTVILHHVDNLTVDAFVNLQQLKNLQFQRQKPTVLPAPYIVLTARNVEQRITTTLQATTEKLPVDSTTTNNADSGNDNNTVALNGDATVAEAPAEQPQPQRNMWSIVKGLLIRVLFMYFISSLFRRGSTPPPGSFSNDSAPGGLSIPSQAFGPGVNIFPKGALLDVYIYLSDSQNFTEFEDKEKLFWFLSGVRYGDWEAGENMDGTFMKSTQFEASKSLMENGTLYLHVYFVPSGKTPSPRASHNYSRKHTFHASKMITKYKRRKISNTVNLLTGETEGPRLTEEDMIDGVDPVDRSATNSAFHYLPPVTHWHPNFTVQLLDDHTPWTRGSIPPPLDEYISFYGETNEYYPVIFMNDYWNLHEDYQPVNSTTPVLNLTLTFAPISLFRWQMYTAQTMRNKWYNQILGDNVLQESDEEQDTLKKTILETNPYLLGMTVVVSLVHSVFEILAFKNDIQFWRSRQSLEGLSVRSVFFNVFQSAIVVLYVFDHDTNFMVKMSVAVGLLIECWKIKKVVNIKLDRENPLLGFIPRVRFLDNSSYIESETKKYDQLAFRYLSWLLYPLLGGYAVYSLMYQEHRGWYSWVLSMLYGFLLTFGFIMMTPQLFINYKLKSVAHLPWRMLTYKALNTFIDDIFAFVIRMPTLYRLGCLRDDVIFFIFLYQRWIYPIDPKRINEFGVSKDMLETKPDGDGTASTTPPLSIEGTSQVADAMATASASDETKKTK